MRIGVTADPHFHSFPEFARTTVWTNGVSINSRLADQLDNFWNMAVAMHANGCSHLFINGDLFHVRGQIHADVYQCLYDLFEWIIKQLSMKIVILTGNHDQQDKAGKVHSVYGFKDLVTVVDESHMIRYAAGKNIYMVPYMTDKNLLLSAFDNCSGAEILFAHCGVDGAFIGPVEYQIKDPITAEHLHPERYNWCLLGHYHKPQPVAETVLYIGSPMQINRGERGEKKRWLLWDSDEPEKIQSFLTKAKQFRTVTYAQWKEFPQVQSDYCDVELDGTEDMAEVHDAIKGKTVKLIAAKVEKETKSRIQLDERMTDTQLLTAYAKHCEAGSDKYVKRLVALGLDLLQRGGVTNSSSTRLLFSQTVIKNFMAIGHANLKLSRPGSVIALLGNNESQEGFTSNGAGKSSLLPESIFWCLWGVTGRELPADKVVNRKAKRNCSVRTILLAGKHKLDITRYRKNTAMGGDGILLLVDGKDETQGTPKLTQEKIDTLLGVDYDTFSSIMAFSPDTLRFMTQGDAHQKHVLDSILQTKRFTAGLTVAKNAVTSVKVSRQGACGELETLSTAREGTEARIVQYTALNAAWEERERARVQELENEVAELEQHIASCESKIQDARNVLEDLEDELIKAVESKPDMTGWNEANEANSTALGKTDGLAESNESKRVLLQELLDAAVEQAGKPCPTCGQKVSNTGKLIAKYQADLHAVLAEAKRLELLGLRQNEVQSELRARKEAYRKATADILRINTDIKSNKFVISHNTQAIANCEVSISKLKTQIETVPVNDYAVLVDNANQELLDTQAAANAKESEIKSLDGTIARLEFWIRGFGGSGIRSFMLDHILPQLGKYTNHYLDKMSGGSITVSFQSHKETSSVDKFMVHAVNDEGSDIYKGNSSGEKRRIDVCILIALFRVAYNRTKLNVLLLDEALDTLDQAGLESVVEVLEDLAKELKLTIFVTSHTELNNYLYESITVVKSDGLSTLQE